MGVAREGAGDGAGEPPLVSEPARHRVLRVAAGHVAGTRRGGGLLAGVARRRRGGGDLVVVVAVVMAQAGAGAEVVLGVVDGPHALVHDRRVGLWPVVRGSRHVGLAGEDGRLQRLVVRRRDLAASSSSSAAAAQTVGRRDLPDLEGVLVLVPMELPVAPPSSPLQDERGAAEEDGGEDCVRPGQ